MEPQKQTLIIPAAIVIAGALIAGAVFFLEHGKPASPSVQNGHAQLNFKNIPPATAADHIQGDLNAPVKIVEYMDFECPFCKQLDGTMQQIMRTYPGKVAWIIRNFPLSQLHPNAPKLALAAECAASLGGNDVFWKFKDAIFAAAPANSLFDMTRLTETGQTLGLDGKTFDSCIASGKYVGTVTQEFNDAVNSGAQGTPFSVLITKDGTQVPIPGAQTFDALKSAVDTALKNS